MAQTLFTIKKRSTFVMIRNHGEFIKGKNMNIQILQNQDLENSIDEYQKLLKLNILIQKKFQTSSKEKYKNKK